MRTLLLTVGLLVSGLAEARCACQQDDGIAAALTAKPRPHPRLFFTPTTTAEVRQRLKDTPVLAKVSAFILATADALEAVPPMARQQVGRRLLGVSRTVLKRVTFLAYAHRITGEERYLQRAEKEMLAAAAFADWNPSHFLDVAEMTAALAIGYDWLHSDLTEAGRTAIRTAIVDKGLKPSLRGGWWVTTSNNWNQVCHGGLTVGALAVLEHEPKLAQQIITRAHKNLPRATHEYEPDGAYPEGPGYWVYGTSYHVLMMDALQTALGTDFGLASATGFAKSGGYMLHVTGPSNLFFNYSDGGAKHKVMPALRWFAARQENPALLWHDAPALEAFVATAKPASSSAHRLLPFLLLWAKTNEQRIQPKHRSFYARGRTPIAMHRSSWDAAATFLAIKGGSPSANHAHMDIGSFVLESDGVRWAHDLGSQSYHSLESKGIRLWDRSQRSQRWSVFRLNNHSHNTLVVDGKLQRVKGSGAIETFVAESDMPHTIVDMSAAYAGQLRNPRRGAALRSDRSVVIQDEFETLPGAAETTVRWGMLTKAKVKLDGTTAILTQKGQQLTVRVLSPNGARFVVYETARPRASHDTPNRGTRMLGFEVQLPAATKQRLTVVLAPGAAPIKPHPAALDDWR